MRRIGGIFGRQPFGPIYEHMVKVGDCVNLLRPLLDAVIDKDYDNARSIVKHMDELEGAADHIKNDIREHLSHSLFSASERGDIVIHLKVQDDIADACQDFAQSVSIRRTEIPEELAGLFQELTDGVCDAVDLLITASRRLRKVAESSFDKSRVEETRKQMKAVRLGEYEVEKKGRVILQRMFEIEDKLKPVTLHFLMTFVDELSHVANEAENTADSIIRMVSHR